MSQIPDRIEVSHGPFPARQRGPLFVSTWRFIAPACLGESSHATAPGRWTPLALAALLVCYPR
jgi:hypothetical protein